MSVLTKPRQTHAGSSKPEDKAEMYEDWKQALKLEGQKNDKEDGSGALFEIVVFGDKTGPPQEGVEINVAGDKMATPQNSVPRGRLKGKARKEARLLHKTSPATSSPKSTSILGPESVLEQLLKEVPLVTLTGNDEEDLSDGKGLVHPDVTITSAATTTAEKLKEAVDADVFPSDLLTREQFGFSKVNTIEEETNLLGLYQGLLIHLPNSPCTEIVQGWQKKKKIAGGIHHSYKSQRGRSWYFDWFKDHQYFVDQTYVNPYSPMSHP